MPFPNYNALAAVWATAPWTAGGTPAISNVEIQQLRPFLPIDTQSQAGLLRPGIGLLYRLAVSPSWPNPQDYNWRVAAIGQIWIVPNGMPGNKMGLKVEARQVVWDGTILRYSYCVCSLDLNPAIYP